MNYIFYSKQEEIIPVVAMTYHALQKHSGLCKLVSNSMAEQIAEESLPENETIYLIGYCFTDVTKETLECMLKRKNKVVWLDNHLCSDTIYKKLLGKQVNLDGLEAVLDREKSIFHIVWDYFNPGVVIPRSVFLLKRWEEYDVSLKDVRYFHIALLLRDEYDHISSDFWKDLFYDPESSLTEEIVAIGRYIAIDQKKKQVDNLSKIFIYKAEDDKEYAFLNSIGDRYMFDVVYQWFDACVAYYYDGTVWNYQVYSKEKGYAWEYAMKHGGRKKYCSWKGTFQKDKDDNVIYWDFLESRKVSPLYEHPKYKEFMKALPEN